jgi:VanZ family protein
VGNVIDYVLRQGGHLLLHVVLGILAWRAAGRTWTHKTALLVALGLTLSYAMFDEFYQIFTPGRSVNVEDLAYNLSGGLIPYILMWGQMLLPARLRTIWCRLMSLPGD